MLSRLIVTFLCAAAIGSVSGAFLTFDPAPLVFEDTYISASFSVKLNIKPAEDVTVYFEGPTMSMSKCAIVFSLANWNVEQQISVMPIPSLSGSSDPLTQPEIKSEIRARAVTVSPLPAYLSSIDILKIRQAPKVLSSCKIGDNIVTTFDNLKVPFNEPGWHQMVSAGDLEIQILMDKCGARLSCITAVVFRYESTVMSLDTSGPVKNIDRYSVTHVTSNVDGIQHTSGLNAGEHRIVFPCGSKLDVGVTNRDGIIELRVSLFLVAGYLSPGGLCNRPPSESLGDKLIGPANKLYNLSNKDEVSAFVNSWDIKNENVLLNPGARASIVLTQQSRTVCTFPENPRPKPVDPVPSTTTATATTGLSTTTTSSSTTSTSTIYPPPPTPSGYVPPPPPPPDVIVEIQKCCQSIFNIPSCNAIVPAESYIQSCISDAQTSGSYVFSDKVKREYLAKCRTLTDDMILDPTKDVIDQGIKIRKECGFGNGTCTNSCSNKGTCTDFGCACSPGFSGMDCSMDLTKATQYDQSVNEYRVNVNITVIQQQTGPSYELPGSVSSAIPAPSVDQSLSSYVGSLPKPSTVSPQIAEKSQPSSPGSYDDLQKPILSSAISLGSFHMVSVAAVVITSYILLL
ncbi:hypothetical protein BASA61_007655 [Batrachochytrium salamandrivorans]|nr:hypothetical protein BASA61_007655 [Batrachochytrium salamandrivorans]